MKTLCVIPARIGSKRLPGKLLLAETGKPLVCHTVERALACGAFDKVVVATGDVAIVEAVAPLGCEVADTFHVEKEGDVSFRNGTERVAFAAEWVARTRGRHDLVVGLQADEPMISPLALGRLVAAMHDHGRDVPYGTIVREEPITIAERFCPDVVQAVVSDEDAATGVMSVWEFRRGGPYWQSHRPTVHVGVYAWWAESLAQYAAMEPLDAEDMVFLEQFRCVSKNWPCLAVAAPHAFAVNTRADYDRFVAAWRAGNP